MAQVINTNIASLNAQRNLTSSQNAVNTSLQRLSTGLRINSAKDDAAGLAISERMTTQITGLNQAVRNANDGISLAQTAEGALSQIGSNLQRIRELAVQSRNATNSDSDRIALQKEVSQLTAEIDRVARDTSFNGTNLLDGSFTSKSFQVGANAGQRISIDSIINANTSALGTSYSVTTAAITTPGTAAAAGATASAPPTAAKFASIAPGGISVTVGDDTTAINLGEIAAVSVTPASNDDADIDAANKAAIRQHLESVAAEITKATGGRVNASINDAGDALELSSLEKFEFGGAAAPSYIDGESGDAQVGFKNLDIKTAANADKVILAMDAALKSINESRADLGAIQNRFSSVVSTLQTTSENLSASRSRIMDADFAAETASLTRGQILQQAGTAMLAQANSLPNNVLTLLRG
ncbi:flagellin [Pigmentiphaga sp. NML080357]|uniref:flagellin n=1 Tax=Pigmentiphaga sp. NML080357 TaxID=2008675 RepID=UPI000B40B11C|nr:flagellin [Pigmentiphaga sp. NML080357]OVZ58050.1 flagellin [Pigmentiphaga sp. NML080357]